MFCSVFSAIILKHPRFCAVFSAIIPKDPRFPKQLPFYSRTCEANCFMAGRGSMESLAVGYLCSDCCLARHLWTQQENTEPQQSRAIAPQIIPRQLFRAIDCDNFVSRALFRTRELTEFSAKFVTEFSARNSVSSLRHTILGGEELTAWNSLMAKGTHRGWCSKPYSQKSCSTHPRD